MTGAMEASQLCLQALGGYHGRVLGGFVRGLGEAKVRVGMIMLNSAYGTGLLEEELLVLWVSGESSMKGEPFTRSSFHT